MGGNTEMFVILGEIIGEWGSCVKCGAAGKWVECTDSPEWVLCDPCKESLERFLRSSPRTFPGLVENGIVSGLSVKSGKAPDGL
jgi:hypothetical protein